VIRVRVENGKLVPLHPIDLPEGAVLLLNVIPPEEIERDIAEAIQEVRRSKQSSEPPSWPGGVKDTLSREEMYDHL
jgi:predicted DNA-binding antitoxin AbrB/MazE fold protein